MTTPQTYTLIAFKPSFIGQVPEWSFSEIFILEEDLTLAALVNRVAELRLEVFDTEDGEWETLRNFPKVDIEVQVEAIVALALAERQAAQEACAQLKEEEQVREDQKNLATTLDLLDALGFTST